MIRRVLRYLSVAALAFWMGGIAFYGGVAVPYAGEVLDTHAEVGRISRPVTRVSNLLGLGVLALLAAHGASAWRSHGAPGRWTLAASWIVLLAAQLALLALWAKLSGMVDWEAGRVHDRKTFYPWHERYMEITGVACLAALVHLWVLLGPPRPGAPDGR